MTTLTMRRIKDDFIVTGPDIEPAKFNNGPMTRSDRVATLEEAKAAFSEELGRVEGVGQPGGARLTDWPLQALKLAL
jgi:hypothetical protein